MRIKLILAILLGMSSNLLAGVSGEIFTWGYHKYVVDTLSAVGGIAASDNTVLLKIAITIGLFVLIMKVIFDNNAKQLVGMHIFKYLILILIVQALLLSAPNDDNHAYAVVDKISLQTTEVRQVPKGIGELLSFFTNIEDGIMKKMEVYFTTPHSLSYRQAGLGFTLGTQMQIMNSKIADEYLYRSLTEYIDTCKIQGDFADGTQNLSDVLSGHDSDILTRLGTNKTLLTMVYSTTNPNGLIISCKSAWNAIRNRIGTEAVNLAKAYANSRGISYSAYQAKVAEATMITGTNSATVSAKEQLESAIARNSTLDAVKQIASFSGISNTQLAKQVSLSELTMTNSAILSNYQAQGTLPILRAVVTAFIISLTWILAILAIITLSVQYIRLILVLNIWLMLWSPLFQILNYAIDLMVSDALSMYSTGITATNQVGVYEILGGKLAIMTNLVWLVPMLAFAIAKGSEHGLVSFISGMTQPVQNATQNATQEDLKNTLSGSTSYTTSSGRYAEFGGGTNKSPLTTANVNQDGNTVSQAKNVNGSINATTTKSSLNNGVQASINSGGEIAVDSGNISSTITSSAATNLDKSKQKVQSLANNMTNMSSQDMAALSSVSKDNTITDVNGSKVSIGEQNAESLNRVTSNAAKEAMSASSLRAWQETVMNDKSAMSALGINVNTDRQALGKIASIATGASAKIGADGKIGITTKDGNTFKLDKNSSWGKEFTDNYSKSISNQLTRSKEDTQAFSNALSFRKGESQSQRDSTSNQISKVFSEMEQASKTYSDSQRVSQDLKGQNLNEAFKNFFDKSPQWQNRSDEDKTGYMVRQINEWQQRGAAGITDMKNFIDDNVSSRLNIDEPNDMVNMQNNINAGKADLMNKTSGVTGASYNPNAYSDVETSINNKGDKLQNTSVVNQSQMKDAQSKVYESGNVQERVDNTMDNIEKDVRAADNSNKKKVEQSFLIGVASSADNVVEGAKDIFQDIAGQETFINADAQRQAKINETTNKNAYDNAKVGDNPLVKKGWISDDIDKDMLKDADTETLARIFQYDKVENDLSSDSKELLQNELKNRGYDSNNNEYSSKYEEYVTTAYKSTPNIGSSAYSYGQMNKSSDFPTDFKSKY